MLSSGELRVELDGELAIVTMRRPGVPKRAQRRSSPRSRRDRYLDGGRPRYSVRELTLRLH